ncbi:MAG: hypothetical protein KJ604_20485 [Gammaproteobacteria bacterium]|nr:hypothetical protein [Gammaproteobacteria bacterium]
MYSKDNTGISFMTNMKAGEADIVRKAADETGFNIVVRPATRNGEPLPGSIGVYTREPSRDHTPFWNRVRELRAKSA